MTNIFTLEPATEEGIVLQTNHYYPFGMSYATNAQSSIVQPWRFGGKELMCDASLNLYDFEARLYSPVTGRFVQVDPMAEKYYPISPFAYCGNNPITYSDPDGMDIWDIDENNNMTRTDDDTQDAFYVLQNGKRDEKHSLHFDNGTFKYDDETNMFMSNESSSSASLFSFLAQNSKIEYGLISTHDSTFIIFTDQSESKIDMTQKANYLERQQFTIKTMIHSHPGNSGPSGMNEKDLLTRDKYVATLFEESNLQTVYHYVYLPVYDSVVEYNSKQVFNGLIPFSATIL